MEDEDIIVDDFSNDDHESLKMFTGDTVSVMSVIAEMFNFYKFQFDDGKSPIKYLDEGGEARNIYEGVAYMIIFFFLFYLNSMALMYFLPYAKGNFLDILGKENPRIPAGKSKRELLFYLPDEGMKDYNITIPAYTVAFTEDDLGLEFETTQDAILEAGQNSISVPAQSLYGGTEYNVASNTVNLLEDEIDDLEVTNPNPFIGATDDEDDESYRARLLEEKRDSNFGSLEWYKDSAEKIKGVHDVNIVNCVSGDFTIGIIVNPPTETIIDDVIDFFSNYANTPAGVNAYIYGATSIHVDIIIENISFAKDIDPSDGIKDIENLLAAWFNSFKIVQKFSRKNLLTFLSEIEGLIEYNLIAPAADIEAAENHVFVAGEIDLRRS